MKDECTIMLEHFVEEWVLSLPCNDRIGFSLFMCYHLENMFEFTKMKAAEFASIMVGWSERTIRQWRTEFYKHGELEIAVRANTSEVAFYGLTRS